MVAHRGWNGRRTGAPSRANPLMGAVMRHL